jgi:transposase-like protein
MEHICPNPACNSSRTKKAGFFHRSSDGKDVQRRKCLACGHTFSEATGTPEFGQKKRHLNDVIFALLASGGSLNRTARNLGTNRKTVFRKLCFLGARCAALNREHNQSQAPATHVQFDEMETFVHTKCKPVSIALAVEDGTRRIMGLQVSAMPAKGMLAGISRAKYGPRPDERGQGLRKLFEELFPLCGRKVALLSDKCPRYEPAVRKAIKRSPGSEVDYRQTKGARGCVTGQGELKRLVRDPLFSLNHTCAMFRAWVNRLFRRTWNTTKKVSRLEHHLHIYAYYHNTRLLKPA